MNSGAPVGQRGTSTRSPESRNGKEVVGSFDWIGDFEDFKDLLAPAALGLGSSPRMLMVGCGTSTLSEKLYHAGYTDMVNVDIDEDQIAHMRAQHLDKPTMQWKTADITDMTPHFSEGGCFEAIVDKGTLDALLCTDQAAEVPSHQCHRLPDATAAVWYVLSYELMIALCRCSTRSGACLLSEVSS